MSTSRIIRVDAVTGLVDKLMWTVAARADFWGAPPHLGYLALDWVGRVVLSLVPGAPTNAPALVAAWVQREHVTRTFANDDLSLSFETPLPGDALDRVERFRDGGPLFAHVEGSFFVLQFEGESSPRPPLDRAVAVFNQLTQRKTALWTNLVRTEPFELTRDQWAAGVIPALRPPGRVVLEVRLPAVAGDEEIARRALGHIDAAQAAFDVNNTGETARLVYRAIDELLQLEHAVERRYGEFMRKRLSDQAKSIKSLCDPERHGERPSGPTGAVDRPLAQHLLVTAKALASLYLA